MRLAHALLPWQATTYSILTIFAYCLAMPLKQLLQIAFVKYLVFALMLGVAFMFLASAFFNKNYAFSLLTSKLLNKKFSRLVTALKLEPYGLEGLMLGMSLGLIPCGLVYGVILLALNAENLITATLCLFLFGLSTIPGLFLATYLGSQLMTRFSSTFKLFYSTIMFINSLLIACYALKIL
jgi:sulfite exporter TauE/SafE